MPPRTLENVRDAKKVAMAIVREYIRIEVKEPADIFACHYRNVPADRYIASLNTRLTFAG